MTEQRQILILLIAATLIPMGALAWLGVRMLAQDRDIERQRRRDAFEVAAGRLALALDRRLQDVEERLTRGAGVRLLPTGLQAFDTPDPVPGATLVARDPPVPSVTCSANRRTDR